MIISPIFFTILYAVLTAIVIFVIYLKRELILSFFSQNSEKKEVDNSLNMISNAPPERDYEGEIEQLKGENKLLKNNISDLRLTISKNDENIFQREKDIKAYIDEIERLKNESSKGIQSFEEKINELQEETKEKETSLQLKIEELTSDKENFQNKINELERNSELRKMGFKVQSLMSAGPRKTTRDQELGEDVSGFITKGDDLFFWVLDGTSDEAMIVIDGVGEVFSCRKLAVQLAYQLAENASKHHYLTVNSWVENSVDNVLKDWKASLSNEKIYFHTERYVTAGSKNVATFKTTMAVGRWNCVNGRLEVFRVGDSKIVAFNKDGKADLFKTELKDQVTFQIVMENEKLEIYDFDNSDNIQTATEDNVIGLIAFSDGLSKTSERHISEDFTSWKEVVDNKPQLTNDDKTLLIASIVD